MKPDTPNRYGTVTRVLHWSMALCMVWMVLSTLIPDWLTERSAQAFFRNGHKQVGSVLFVLIIVRLLWAMANASRRPASISLPAKLGHWALYALMLAIPTIALLRQYGSGRAFSPLGLPIFPGFEQGEKIDWMVQLGGLLHGELAWALVALVGGHVLMALWHRYKRGAQDVLPRMIG